MTPFKLHPATNLIPLLFVHSRAENAVVDLSYKNRRQPEPIPICYYNGRDDEVVMATYNNDSYSNYTHHHHHHQRGTPVVLPVGVAPRTPPPEYTEQSPAARAATPLPPHQQPERSRVAFRVSESVVTPVSL